MSDVLYLAWRYVASHKFKTGILVAALTLILFLPAGLQVLVNQSERAMTARAEATPLIVGAKGSPIELVLSSLYFEGDVPESTTHAEVTRIADTGFADPIPLYARFRAGPDPIVGTSLDYFDFRGLRIVTGRPMARLGDCVLGANVAARREKEAAAQHTELTHVISSPESVFDLAGVYPLKMHITGTLAPTGSADDNAIFVDVRTTWIIEGLGHGHADLSKPDQAAAVLDRDGNKIRANASVVQFNEITDNNVDSFHFHGSVDAFPITAVLAVPHSAKDRTLLMGRYQAPDERQQILEPATVVDDLLDTVVTVKGYVVAALLLVGLATFAVAALVFLLSFRLRRREIETLVKIGGSRPRVAAILFSEVALVLLLAVLFAALLTGATAWFGADALRRLLA